MEVVTIQSQAFQELVSKLDAINERVNAKDKEPKEKWLDNQELMQLLKISKRTAQHYRISVKLREMHIGGKVVWYWF